MKPFPIYRLFWASLLLTLAITVALAGCAFFEAPEEQEGTPLPPTATASPTVTPTPSPTPLPRGGSLTVRLTEDIPWLQPWRPRSRSEEQVISLLYSGLMRLDDTLRPQPDLARKWEASADGHTLTFTLRTDVTWHDGKPLDAVDVHFTLDRLRALPVTSTALLSELQYIASISTPDRHTVVLSLNERHAPLLAHLTLPILPRHLLEDAELRSLNFWDVPVGSGPFKLERRERHQSIVLARNEHFYRGAPLLALVAFVGSADNEVTLDALADERLMLAELDWSTMRSFTGTLESLRLGGYPENGFYFLGFNLRDGRPFADVRVRQALAQAIDLPRLVEVATRGQGIPIASSGVPGSWADLTPLSLDDPDPDSARELLAEAGWDLPPGSTIRHRNNKPFSATLVFLENDTRRAAAAERIADIAASIGLQLALEPVAFSELTAKYAPPYEFDLLLGSWLGGAGDPSFGDYRYYDPDDFALFHSSQIQKSTIDTRTTRNFVGFNDRAYDSQIERARQLYGIDARAEAYRQTQARVANLLPYLYLWNDIIPVVLSTRVTTLDGPVDLTTPNYLWNIERWHLTDAYEHEE